MGSGYLTSLFLANPSSYFLQELQRCLKDPDWLAQLFIKHVRLKGAAPEGRGLGVGQGSAGASPSSPALCSLNFTPVRSAGCICMWCIVRISPSQSTWCQNSGTATLRSVAEVPWGRGDRINHQALVTTMSWSPGAPAAARAPPAAQRPPHQTRAEDHEIPAAAQGREHLFPGGSTGWDSPFLLHLPRVPKAPPDFLCPQRRM